MAYENLPKVDPSAERSEESVLAVRGILSQKNGFTCREDHPDLGVDLTVELLREGGATNHRFVVQIKSAARLAAIHQDGKEYISLTFPTSRINYLCQHLPAYGLIVLYNDHDQTLYYDFVEEIVARIEKPPDQWKKQQDVNIHVPCANLLSDEAAKKIHAVMQRRFENAASLINARGAEYGLPVLAWTASQDRLDISNPTEVARFLAEYGGSLFNGRDFEMLVDLIERVPVREILQSAELGFIVALVYAETGRYVEAEYYLPKALANAESLTPEKAALLHLTSAEVDYRLGRTDTPQYVRLLQVLYPQFESPANQLGVRVRIAHLEVLLSITNWSYASDERLLRSLKEIEQEIRSASLDQWIRLTLLLHVADEIHQVGIDQFTHSITEFRVRAKTIGEDPLDVRVKSARGVLAILGSATRIVEEVAGAIVDGPGKEILTAHTYLTLTSMFFSFAMNSLMLAGETPVPQEHQTLYQARYRQAIAAYNTFIAKQDLDESLSALSIAYEIGALHDHLFSEPIRGPTKEELVPRLDSLSHLTRRLSFESLIDRHLKETLPAQAHKDRAGMAEMSDDEVNSFARTFAQSLRLPTERTPNVVNDILAIRRFERIISNSSAELLQNLTHTRSAETMYAAPIIYTGRCLACGYSTADSPNVDNVIAEYISAHGKECPRRTG